MLTKQSNLSTIELNFDSGSVGVKTTNIILENGVEVSRRPHRAVFTPDEFRNSPHLTPAERNAIADLLAAHASAPPPAENPLDAALIALARERRKRIDALLTAPIEWLMARAVELLNKKTDGTITPAESTELTNLQNTWMQIKAIDTAAKTIEAEIRAAPDPSAVPIATNPAWP